MYKFLVNVDETSPLSNGTIVKNINIDEEKTPFSERGCSKIFQENPETGIITISHYGLYILAAQAKADFSRYIVEKDSGNRYHIEKMEVKPIEEAVKEAMEKNKIASANYDEIIAAEKAKHEGWFIQQEQIENIAPYVKNFISNKHYSPSDIIAIVDAYKIANKYVKDIGRENLPKAYKSVISPEHKDEWADIVKSVKDKTGFLTEKEIKDSVIEAGKTYKKVSTRLALTRAPGVNTSQLSLYIEDFIYTMLEDELNKF